MNRELLQQVLDDICGAKLCEINSMSSRMEMIRLMDKAIEAIKQELAKPEPRKEWVGLTDDDVAWADGHSHGNTTWTKQKAFSRAIEAKLKEKNS
jgi:hypothetical protein